MAKIKMQIGKYDKRILKLISNNSFVPPQEVSARISFIESGPYIELTDQPMQEALQSFSCTSLGSRYKIKSNTTIVFTTKYDVLTFILINYGYNHREEAERVFGKAHIFYQDDEVTEFRNFVQIRTSDNILFQVVAIWREPTTESNKHLKDHSAYYAIFSNMSPSEIRVVFE